MTKTMTAEDLLTTEVRHLRSSINNAIVNRRDHPSYGYTKAKITALYHELEGMLFALHVVRTGETSAARRLVATQVYSFLFDGDDLDALAARVKGA